MKRYKLKKAKFPKYFISTRKLYFGIGLLGISLLVSLAVYLLIRGNNRVADTSGKTCANCTTHQTLLRNKMPDKKLVFKSYTFDDFSTVYKIVFGKISHTNYIKFLQASITQIKVANQEYARGVTSLINSIAETIKTLGILESSAQKYAPEQSMFLLLRLLLLFYKFITEKETEVYLTHVLFLDTSDNAPTKDVGIPFFVNFLLVNQFLRVILMQYVSTITSILSEFKDIEKDIKINKEYSVFVQGFYDALYKLSKTLLVVKKIDNRVGEITMKKEIHRPNTIKESEAPNGENYTELNLLKESYSLKRFILLSFYPMYFYMFEFNDNHNTQLRHNIKLFLEFNVVKSKKGNNSDHIIAKIENNCEYIFSIYDFEGNEIKNDLESKTTNCLIQLEILNEYIN